MNKTVSTQQMDTSRLQSIFASFELHQLLLKLSKNVSFHKDFSPDDDLKLKLVEKNEKN